VRLVVTDNRDEAVTGVQIFLELLGWQSHQTWQSASPSDRGASDSVWYVARSYCVVSGALKAAFGGLKYIAQDTILCGFN
jgi:hypothetical protein